MGAIKNALLSAAELLFPGDDVAQDKFQSDALAGRVPQEIVFGLARIAEMNALSTERLLPACRDVAEFLTNGTPVYPGSEVGDALVRVVRDIDETMALRIRGALRIRREGVAHDGA